MFSVMLTIVLVTSCMNDLNIWPHILSNPDSSLPRRNSHPFIVCCSGEAFKFTSRSHPSGKGPAPGQSEVTIETWTVMFFISVTSQTGGENIGKISLEDYRHILGKIEKTENLFGIDNLDKVVGSSPIYQ